ncbi:MAG TPA: multidrug effflux MFS transporter [Glaciibacter sp.]|nr:multidrug effflux MFS transporter [Glaciibacter sp.]
MADRGAGASPISPALVLTLGLLAATAPLSLDAYLPALPAIATEFGVSAQQAQLSFTACLLGLGVGQILAGPLGDRWGRRGPMLAGAGLYVISSLACAVAPTAGALIVLRLIQGLAGAVGLVLSRAVVHDLVKGRSAVSLYSQLAAISGAAPVIAPIAGGLIITVADWRVVFVVLAGLGVVTAAAVFFTVGETHPVDRRSSAGLATVMRTFRSLLRDRTFAVYATLVMLSSAVLFSYIASTPFVLQTVFGLTQMQFALSFAAVGGALVLASVFNARLVRRHQPLVVLRIAAIVQLLGIAALGALIAVRLFTGWTSIPLLIVLLTWSIAPCGIITPTSVSLAMERSGRHAGAASGLLGASMFLVGGLVSPLSGSGNPAAIMAILMLSFSLAITIVTHSRGRRRRTDSAP